MRYRKIELFNRPFLLDPDDSLDLEKWGTYEPYELSLITDNLLSTKNGISPQYKTAVDIGAHIGYVSRAMAETGARVISFEPNPINYAFLECNAQLGGGSIFPHKQALSDNDIPIQICMSPVNSGDDTLYPFDDYDRAKIYVKPTTFDEFFKDVFTRMPVFVKIDVQGSELKVLRGMKKLLSVDSPTTMAIEFWQEALRAAGDVPQDLMGFLWEHGFKMWEIKESSTDGRLEPVTDLGFCDREDLLKGYCNLWAVRE